MLMITDSDNSESTVGETEPDKMISRFSPENQSWRLEVKFAISEMMLPSVRTQLLLSKFGFRWAYEDRVVNNVYFDSETMSAAWANHSGIPKRQKVRLRWYGDEGPYKLEIKIKRGAAGAKIAAPVDFSSEFLTHSWKEIIRRVRIGVPGEYVPFLDSQTRPTLINSYRRSYYETPAGRVRATIDSDVKSADQRGRSIPHLNLRTSPGNSAVLELKAAVEEEQILREVAGGLGLRMSKNSKYTRGLAQQAG
jgi:hypothetical protein